MSHQNSQSQAPKSLNPQRMALEANRRHDRAPVFGKSQQRLVRHQQRSLRRLLLQARTQEELLPAWSAWRCDGTGRQHLAIPAQNRGGPGSSVLMRSSEAQATLIRHKGELPRQLVTVHWRTLITARVVGEIAISPTRTTHCHDPGTTCD